MFTNKLLMVLGIALGLPAAVHAEEIAGEISETTEKDPASSATADGSFLPLTLPAQVGATPAFAFASGGYDTARQGPGVEAVTEARLWGPVALRAGATYSGAARAMRPSVGARVQLLRQEAHGIDGSISVAYKAEGFTEPEGEIESCVSVARRLESVSLLGNLAYGQDPEGNERDGEVRLAALHLRGRWAVGMDSRARFAIGAQHGKATTTEPTFDALAGPVGALVAGRFVLFAQIGPSAVTFPAQNTRVGLGSFAGLGATFR
jgi:hypothetical protein